MSTEHDNRVADLLAQVSKERERWDPEPGDAVAGIVADLRELDGEYNSYPLVVLDVGDRLVEISCGRSVLRTEVMQRDVRVGDTLAVKYDGPTTSKAGKSYHGYTVAHRRAGVTNTEPAQPNVPTVDPTEEPF